MRMQPMDRLEAQKAAELEPAAVRAYLIKQGWREAGKYGRSSELFAKDTADGLAELIVPTNAKPSDRALLMTSLVAGLSGVEDRPAEAVVEEICAGAETDSSDFGANDSQEVTPQFSPSDMLPRSHVGNNYQETTFYRHQKPCQKNQKST